MGTDPAACTNRSLNDPLLASLEEESHSVAIYEHSLRLKLLKNIQERRRVCGDEVHELTNHSLIYCPMDYPIKAS